MIMLFQRIKQFIVNKRDRAFVERQYWEYCKKKIDWKDPKTYNEKLQIYKLSDKMEKLWPYADKWAVRKIVERKVGANILNRVYGLWKNASDIDFNKLPRQFVLKATHGSNWNIVVKDKKIIDKDDIRSKLNSWLKINYYYWYGRERQYKLIKPKIICEKYLEDKKGNLLDYKLFCFDGKVHLIQITIDRFSDHKTTNFYDVKWKLLPFTFGAYPNSNKKYPKPKNLSKMIEIAEKLASDLKHARVDLYNVDGRIYFGEVTLTHGNGKNIFHPEKYNRYYGNLFHL
jgi:hypothetical protein